MAGTSLNIPNMPAIKAVDLPDTQKALTNIMQMYARMQQMQRARQLMAQRVGGGRAGLGRGGFMMPIPDPENPGQTKYVPIYGSTKDERQAQIEYYQNQAINSVLQNDIEIQKKLAQLDTLDVNSAEKVLEDIRKNDLPRLQKNTGLDSAALLKTVLKEPQASVSARKKAVSKDPFYNVWFQTAKAEIPIFADALKSLVSNETAQEKLARGQRANQLREEARAASPYLEDQARRQAAGENLFSRAWTLGSIPTNIGTAAIEQISGLGTSLAAGGIGGALGRSLGTLAPIPGGSWLGQAVGQFIGGGLGNMPATESDYLAKVAADQRLSDAQKIQAIESGAGKAKGLGFALGAAMLPTERLLSRAVPFVRNAPMQKSLGAYIKRDVPVTATEGAAMGALTQAGQNYIYGQSTGLNTPLLENVGEAAMAGLAAAPLFGAMRTYFRPAVDPRLTDPNRIQIAIQDIQEPNRLALPPRGSDVGGLVPVNTTREVVPVSPPILWAEEAPLGPIVSPPGTFQPAGMLPPRGVRQRLPRGTGAIPQPAATRRLVVDGQAYDVEVGSRIDGLLRTGSGEWASAQTGVASRSVADNMPVTNRLALPEATPEGPIQATRATRTITVDGTPFTIEVGSSLDKALQAGVVEKAKGVTKVSTQTMPTQQDVSVGNQLPTFTNLHNELAAISTKIAVPEKEAAIKEAVIRFLQNGTIADLRTFLDQSGKSKTALAKIAPEQRYAISKLPNSIRKIAGEIAEQVNEERVAVFAAQANPEGNATNARTTVAPKQDVNGTSNVSGSTTAPVLEQSQFGGTGGVDSANNTGDSGVASTVRDIAQALASRTSEESAGGDRATQGGRDGWAALPGERPAEAAQIPVDRAGANAVTVGADSGSGTPVIVARGAQPNLGSGGGERPGIGGAGNEQHVAPTGEGERPRGISPTETRPAGTPEVSVRPEGFDNAPAQKMQVDIQAEGFGKDVPLPQVIMPPTQDQVASGNVPMTSKQARKKAMDYVNAAKKKAKEEGTESTTVDFPVTELKPVPEKGRKPRRKKAAEEPAKQVSSDDVYEKIMALPDDKLTKFVENEYGAVDMTPAQIRSVLYEGLMRESFDEPLRNDSSKQVQIVNEAHKAGIPAMKRPEPDGSVIGAATPHALLSGMPFEFWGNHFQELKRKPLSAISSVIDGYPFRDVCKTQADFSKQAQAELSRTLNRASEKAFNAMIKDALTESGYGKELTKAESAMLKDIYDRGYEPVKLPEDFGDMMQRAALMETRREVSAEDVARSILMPDENNAKVHSDTTNFC